MEARTLLSSTKSTVGDIASRLGFSDAAGFCKFFKRNMGRLLSIIGRDYGFK